MELISYLKDDHSIIRKFIHEFDEEENFKIKNKIFSEMLIFVRAHFRAEEQAIYSKCLKSNIFEMNELALDGYEEHHLLEDLIYRIKNSEKNDELWLSRTRDFCQILDLHLSAEETDLFTELKAHFTAVELDKAAVIYLKSKKFELTIAEQDQQRDATEDQEIILN